MQFKCVRSEIIDDKIVNHFHRVWPHYRKWFLSEGLEARQSYAAGRAAIEHYMPEILNIYDKIVTLVGGGDAESRFLSLYIPPPYMTGCSQAVWNRDELYLIKNYDYGPNLFERRMFYTNWLKPIIGMSDCVWGLLDGINSDGLIASLTFGGSNLVGGGFGIPLIVRYILETCATTQQAMDILQRVPSHMAYNVSLLDKEGSYIVAMVRPGKPTSFQHELIATNHQEHIDWQKYATLSKTIERYQFLKTALQNQLLSSAEFKYLFNQSPLYNLDYRNGFGTLYNIIYNPHTLSAVVNLHGNYINQSIHHFVETRSEVSWGQ